MCLIPTQKEFVWFYAPMKNLTLWTKVLANRIATVAEAEAKAARFATDAEADRIAVEAEAEAEAVAARRIAAEAASVPRSSVGQ